MTYDCIGVQMCFFKYDNTIMNVSHMLEFYLVQRGLWHGGSPIIIGQFSRINLHIPNYVPL